VNNLKWKIFLLIIAGFLSLWFFIDVSSLIVFLNKFKRGFGENYIFYIALAYSVALAVPFFPGAEIGICLMCMFGERGVFIAYTATIVGLSASFLVGRLFRGRLNLKENRIMKNLNTFSIYIPRGLTLAILLNFPGNIIFGGGGGISFTLGIENKLKYRQFVAIITLATLPVPLFVYFGIINIDKYLV